MKPQSQLSFRFYLVLLLLIFITVPFARGQDVRDLVLVQTAHADGYAKSAAVSKLSFTTTGGNIGPARAGAIINYALIAPIIILGSASAFSDDTDASIVLGAAATIIAGIGIPVSELIAGSTRRSTGVRGSIPLRIVGWVGYGLTLVDAITMLALSEDVEFGPALILPVAILGALSTTCFGIDNSKTVAQAKNAQPKITMLPTIHSFRDFTGKNHQTVGIRINF